MNISLGNSIVAIAFVIAVGVMIWQIMLANPPIDSDDGDTWRDDVDDAETRLDESEEFLRRMERLSKRNQDENDKK